MVTGGSRNDAKISSDVNICESSLCSKDKVAQFKIELNSLPAMTRTTFDSEVRHSHYNRKVQ